MCGIAGIIYRDGTHEIGRDMTRMLQSMKHRGPDSTGYALYRPHDHQLVMRYKLADANTPRDFEFSDRLDRNQDRGDPAPEGDGRRHPRRRGGDRVRLPRRLHAPEREPQGARRPDRGRPGRRGPLARPLARDRQGPRRRRGRWPTSTISSGFIGTHAIGHVRMATESDVDISGAHPYWAYPFSDVAVVHNGQLTNYFQWKRRLERSGHRFQSECDSEIIAVYLAEKMSEGASLEDAMRESLEELDGVFTYIAVTADALGVCKDEMAAKPLVLYEADDLVALASEEIAIRADRRPRDRHVRPVRGRGAGVAAVGESQDHVRRARARRAVRRGAAHRGDRATTAPTFDAHDLTTRQINLELRRLLYEEGINGRHGPQPGLEALARGRHPHALPDHVRRQPRLLRLRAHRRARDPHHRPGRLVGLREHDVGRRHRRRQRRLADGGRHPRRRRRRQGPGRRAHRDRPEGRHDHRPRRRRLDDRLHDAARPPDHPAATSATASATRCTTGRSTSAARSSRSASTASRASGPTPTPSSSSASSRSTASATRPSCRSSSAARSSTTTTTSSPSERKLVL